MLTSQNRKKIKILYVVSTLRASGPTNQLFGIVSNIDNEEFDIRILTLSPEPHNSKFDKFIKAGITVNSLNLNRINYFFDGRKKLSNYLNKYDPDILHTSGLRADSISSSFLNKYPVVTTIRSFAPDDFKYKFGNILGRLMSLKSTSNIKKNSNIVYCSYTLQDMYNEITNNKGHVIQNGVDTKKHTPIKNTLELKKLRSKLDLPDNKDIFISVGGLIDLKDPLTVIKGFDISGKNSNSILLMLGNGELKEKLIKNFGNGDSIKFLGNVTNVDEYMKASDIFISASKSEGLPNTVLEAGSTGLKVILSNIPQHKEIFTSYDNYINYFDVGDSYNLGKILTECDIPEKKERYELHNHIAKNFSMDLMSKKYQMFYKNIVLERNK